MQWPSNLCGEIDANKKATIRESLSNFQGGTDTKKKY
jgi:hypothetical protein